MAGAEQESEEEEGRREGGRGGTDVQEVEK